MDSNGFVAVAHDASKPARGRGRGGRGRGRGGRGSTQSGAYGDVQSSHRTVAAAGSVAAGTRAAARADTTAETPGANALGKRPMAQGPGVSGIRPPPIRVDTFQSVLGWRSRIAPSTGSHTPGVLSESAKRRAAEILHCEQVFKQKRSRVKQSNPSSDVSDDSDDSDCMIVEPSTASTASTASAASAASAAAPAAAATAASGSATHDELDLDDPAFAFLVLRAPDNPAQRLPHEPKNCAAFDFTARKSRKQPFCPKCTCVCGKLSNDCMAANVARSETLPCWQASNFARKRCLELTHHVSDCPSLHANVLEFVGVKLSKGEASVKADVWSDANVAPFDVCALCVVEGSYADEYGSKLQKVAVAGAVGCVCAPCERLHAPSVAAVSLRAVALAREAGLKDASALLASLFGTAVKHVLQATPVKMQGAGLRGLSFFLPNAARPFDGSADRNFVWGPTEPSSSTLHSSVECTTSWYLGKNNTPCSALFDPGVGAASHVRPTVAALPGFCCARRED